MKNRYRITAYSYRTESTETLARPRSLNGAAKRLLKDAEFWLSVGWVDLFLEVDDGAGWRQLYDDEVPRGSDEMGRDERAELLGQARSRPERTLPHPSTSGYVRTGWMAR